MTLIFIGLFILLLVLIVVSSLKKPYKVIKFAIHILGGIVGLWIVDLFLGVFGIEIPINVFTICTVALLGFPGVIVLTILQLCGI
ncbi:MAG: sigmaK-factor processing regulatory BofA [Peptococcaceae bacterium]|nr:sigmaK-factor processing regulatory BofA [Peptococcaceae bacterium]